MQHKQYEKDKLHMQHRKALEISMLSDRGPLALPGRWTSRRGCLRALLCSHADCVGHGRGNRPAILPLLVPYVKARHHHPAHFSLGPEAQENLSSIFTAIAEIRGRICSLLRFAEQRADLASALASLRLRGFVAPKVGLHRLGPVAGRYRWSSSRRMFRLLLNKCVSCIHI